MGVDIIRGELIAAVVIFGANIEHYLEHAIWQLRGEPIPPKPDTDAKRITTLIELLRKEIALIEDDDKRKMLEMWCDAAGDGFIIRNNIVHGVPVPLGGGGAIFMRNPRWGGVERKQDFGMFGGETDTLIMVRDSFAVLLRIIHAVSVGSADLMSNKLAMRAVREARSMLGEFADHMLSRPAERAMDR